MKWKNRVGSSARVRKDLSPQQFISSPMGSIVEGKASHIWRYLENPRLMISRTRLADSKFHLSNAEA
jgi:hypothetical protein